MNFLSNPQSGLRLCGVKWTFIQYFLITENNFRYRKLEFLISKNHFPISKNTLIFRYRKIIFWYQKFEFQISDIEKMQPNFWYQKILIISDIEKSFFDSGNSETFSDIGNYFLIKKLFSDIRKYGINVHLTPHLRLNEIQLLTSGRNEQKLSLIQKTIFKKILH